MKIVLLKDIPNLGRSGETKEIKEGYAKNYLIPQKLGATPGSSLAKEVQNTIGSKKKEIKAKADDMKEKAANIQGKKFVFSVATDTKGNPYSSVGPKEIAEKLGIEERLVKEHFKKVGTFDLKIEFSKDITSNVKIEIKNK